jgi:hypothetical protein
VKVLRNTWNIAKNLAQVLGPDPGEVRSDGRDRVQATHTKAEEVGEVAGLVVGVDGDAVMALLAQDVGEGRREVALIGDGLEMGSSERAFEVEIPLKPDLHAARGLGCGLAWAEDEEVEVRVGAPKGQEPVLRDEAEHREGEAEARRSGRREHAVVGEAQHGVGGKFGRHGEKVVPRSSDGKGFGEKTGRRERAGEGRFSPSRRSFRKQVRGDDASEATCFRISGSKSGEMMHLRPLASVISEGGVDGEAT